MKKIRINGLKMEDIGILLAIIQIFKEIKNNISQKCFLQSKKLRKKSYCF